MVAGFIQIPTSLLEEVRSRYRLTASQYRLWLLLWELDPYGGRWIKLPSPREIAQTLGYHVRTIKRAAQRLEDLKLFQFEIKIWLGRNTTQSVAVTRSQSDLKPARTRLRRRTPEPAPIPEMPVHAGQQPPEQLAHAEPVPPPAHAGATDPVVPSHAGAPDLVQGELLNRAKALGCNLRDPRLREAIEQFGGNLPAALSVLGSQRPGAIRNPTRFLDAALRKGYRADPEKVRPPDIPSLSAIEQSCVIAAKQNDSSFILSRLKALFIDGFGDIARTLCERHPEWQMTITDRGVETCTAPVTIQAI